MPAEVMKQPSGIAPIRVTRPSLKLSPSDLDLNVRFATSACLSSRNLGDKKRSAFYQEQSV